MLREVGAAQSLIVAPGLSRPTCVQNPGDADRADQARTLTIATRANSGGNECASLLVFSRLRAKGWTGRRNSHCRIRPWSASRSSEILLTSTADLTGPFWRHLIRGAHPARLCLYRSSLPRGRDPLNPAETSGCPDSPVECDTGPALLPCPRARPSPTRSPWPRCIPTKAPSRALTCPVRGRSGSWSRHHICQRTCPDARPQHRRVAGAVNSCGVWPLLATAGSTYQCKADFKHHERRISICGVVVRPRGPIRKYGRLLLGRMGAFQSLIGYAPPAAHCRYFSLRRKAGSS